MIVIDASALLEFLLQTPLGARVEARLFLREEECYVALAEAIDAPLLTCDAPLANASGHRARIEVISAQ